MAYLVICTVVLVLVVCFWVYLYKHRNEFEFPAKQPISEPQPKEKVVQYSRFLAESCFTDDYSQPKEDKSLAVITLHQELWEVLKRMDKYGPCPNDRKWFISHINDFCLFMDILSVIEHYPHLTDLFIENLPNPNDLELQKKLISICWMDRKSPCVKVNYTNLLCYFCKRWDFLPEIKIIVLKDPRFETVKNIYELYHK